jgi:hypothetical protein
MSKVVCLVKPPRPRHFNKTHTQVPDPNQVYDIVEPKFSKYKADWPAERKQDLYFLCSSNLQQRPLSALLTFATEFDNYNEHLNRDETVHRLWNEQCDKQTSLLDKVICQLDYEHKINKKYMQRIFGELDAQHKHVKQGPSCSIPVYAYILFERFKNTFRGISKDKGFPNVLLRNMRNWFVNIPSQVIGTLIEYISEKAKTFMYYIGVQNVVFVMCVLQANKMLNGYDMPKLHSMLMGFMIFNDGGMNFNDLDASRREAQCNFRLFELAFLEQMNWKMHVDPVEYTKQVQDLMRPKCLDIDMDCIEFDDELQKATSMSESMSQMLKEAAAVPDQNLCEPMQWVQGIKNTQEGTNFFKDWAKNINTANKLVPHVRQKRIIADPEFWRAIDRENARKAAVRTSPPSPF